MANKTQIYNLAGSLIGTESHITDPDDDRPLARAITAVWELERRAAIRDGEWNFAVRRVGLPALVGAVAYPWGYAYQKPAGCLRILEILNGSARDAYQVEGETILADSGPPLYLRFLADVPNEGLWDEGFAETFAARLAWAVGEKIAGSAYNKGEGWTFYQTMLGRAKGTDARENPPVEQEESDWILARWAGVAPTRTRW